MRLSPTQQSVVDWLKKNADRRIWLDLEYGIVYLQGFGLQRPHFTRATFRSLLTRGVIELDREIVLEKVTGKLIDGEMVMSDRIERIYKLANPQLES